MEVSDREQGRLKILSHINLILNFSLLRVKNCVLDLIYWQMACLYKMSRSPRTTPLHCDICGRSIEDFWGELGLMAKDQRENFC